MSANATNHESMNITTSDTEMGQSLSFVLDNMQEKLQSTAIGNPDTIKSIIDETFSSIGSNSPKTSEGGGPFQNNAFPNQGNVTHARAEDIEMSLPPATMHQMTAVSSMMCLSVADNRITGHQTQPTYGSDMDISSLIDAPQKTLATDGRKSADMDITKPVQPKTVAPSLARSLLERSVLKERSNIMLMQPSSAIPISDRTIHHKLDMEYSKMDSFLMNERACQSIEVPSKSKTLVCNKTIDETIKNKAIGKSNSNWFHKMSLSTIFNYFCVFFFQYSNGHGKAGIEHCVADQCTEGFIGQCHRCAIIKATTHPIVSN